MQLNIQMNPNRVQRVTSDYFLVSGEGDAAGGGVGDSVVALGLGLGLSVVESPLQAATLAAKPNDNSKAIDLDRMMLLLIN